MAKENKPLMIFLAGVIRDGGNIQNMIKERDFDFYAADGGYLVMEQWGISPEYIIGDFDSSKKPQKGQILVYPSEKDETDSELALMLALKNGYREIWMIAPFGGRLDHTVANLALLEKARQAGAQLYLYDGSNLAFLLGEGEHILENRYQYISFFTHLGAVKLSLEGFKYELDRFLLKPNTPLGISNEPRGERPIVRIFDGQALCICIEKERKKKL